MSEPLDYDEPAMLLAYDDADSVLPGRQRTTTLAQAVRTIVEEWSGDQLIEVFIATPSRPIGGLAQVRAIHDRQDRPLPRRA